MFCVQSDEEMDGRYIWKFGRLLQQFSSLWRMKRLLFLSLKAYCSTVCFVEGAQLKHNAMLFCAVAQHIPVQIKTIECSFDCNAISQCSVAGAVLVEAISRRKSDNRSCSSISPPLSSPQRQRQTQIHQPIVTCLWHNLDTIASRKKME